MKQLEANPKSVVVKQGDYKWPRVSGMLIVHVKGANPNGDPDNEGMPRTIDKSTGSHGLISNVSIKAKIRKVFLEFKQEILEDLNLVDKDNYFCHESEDGGFEGKNRQEANQLLGELSEDEVLNRYWDIRVFGGLILEGKDKSKKSAKKSPKTEAEPELEETEDSKEAYRFKRTGCFTIEHLQSVAPIVIQLGTISKQYVFDATRNQTLGPQGIKFVQHGVYCGAFDISSANATKTRCTVDDIRILMECLKRLFDADQSNARPAYSMSIVSLWTKQHKDRLGKGKEEFVEASLPVLKEGIVNPESLKDYVFKDLTDLGGIDAYKQ